MLGLSTTGPFSDALVSVCLAHLEWRYRPPGEMDCDLDMGGLVPEETQKRWRNKISSMKFDKTWQERAVERMTTAVPEAIRLVAQQRHEAGLPAAQTRRQEVK